MCERSDTLVVGFSLRRTGSDVTAQIACGCIGTAARDEVRRTDIQQLARINESSYCTYLVLQMNLYFTFPFSTMISGGLLKWE